MIFQFTAAGEAAFLVNPSLVQVTRVVLGSGVNYTLADPPVNIQGSSVYDSSVAWVKEVIDANTIKFSRLLDNSVGNFNFGEAALYQGGTVIAVGVSTTLITKTQAAGAEQGNKLTLTFFATKSNDNAYGFLTQANSDSNLQLPNALQMDALEPPYSGEPNAYIVNGVTPEDTPCLAYSDLYGRWNFSDKPARFYTGEVFGTPTQTALDIENPHGVTFLSPEKHVLQWISGRLRGYVRRLTSINADSFAWATPLNILPEEGDEFIIVGPEVSGGGSGQALIQFQDEGSNLGTSGTVTSVNFVGAGVTASRVSNAVTVTVAGGGGSSEVFIADLTAASLSGSSGQLFTDWTTSVVSSAPFCAFQPGNSEIEFSAAGLYRVTIQMKITPDDGSWPDGLAAYGSKLQPNFYTSITESISRHLRYNNGTLADIGSFTSTPNPHIVEESDTYVLIIDSGESFTPALYVGTYSSVEDYDMSMRITVEQLKAL